MAVKPHGLANRPGEPYPATFHNQWTHRESNSDLRHARAVSSRWTMSPLLSVDRPGNRTPISSVQTRHLPVGRAALVLSEVRLGIEPSLPPYQSGVQPQHLQTSSLVIADGIEPSLSWLSPRRLCRWTTRSFVSDRGGRRTHKHEALDLIALPVCVPGHGSSGSGCCTRPAELMKLC